MRREAVTPIDAEAFERGVRDHLPALIRVARRWLLAQAPAEDAVQEACMRAWRRYGDFEPGTNLRAWLMAILANVLRETRRKERRLELVDQEVLDRTAVAPDVDERDPFALERIREAFAQLPVEQRVVLQMAEVEGLRYREIAAALDLPMGTVMSRLNRARCKLRGLVARALEARGQEA